MRAAVQTRYGPPDVVRIAEVARPTPKDNEVLVKVHATTVNRTDCGIRGATPFIVRCFTGLVRPRTRVLGNEFAGEVEAVGRGVTTFQAGDRVFGYNGSTLGAHAEFLVTPEDGMLATMPAALTYEEAAPSTEGSHYALSCIRAARIQRGQDVLVPGATGAIGSAAVQLLKRLGAKVTAVCGTEHLELVRGLGADRVVDSFGRCRRLLRPGGRYLSTDLGPLSLNPVLALITPLFGGRRVGFPLPQENQEMIRYLKSEIEGGAFRPLIDRRYPLEEVVEAYRYVETGRKVGNVVIVVEPSDP
jgi:NADPH:quinone reductase-like Zn-dependent oxidoreductase